MTSSTMIATVRARLAAHPPFDRFSAEQLEAIAAHVQIRYHEPDEILFTEGEPPGEEVFQVQKGSLELTRLVDGVAMLTARSDEGDLVGLRAHIAGRDYAATARTREPSLVYAIPAKTILELIDTDPTIGRALASSFAADAPLRGDAMAEAVRSSRSASASGLSLFDETHHVEPSRDVVTCHPDDSVAEAARAMTARNVGSVLAVDEEKRPLGILTDTDLRRRVVSEERDPAKTNVAEVMSSPVMTVPDGRSLAELLGTMLSKRVHHLAVTADGTPASAVVGVLSEHDLLKAHGSLPTVLLNAISRAQSRSSLRSLRDRGEQLLRQYLDAEVSMTLIAAIATSLNDRLIRRSVELAARVHHDELGEFCWLSLGSEGRGEQLLRTDQDNALVFADPAEGEDLEEVRARYLALASHTIATLAEAGFAECPGNIMASNPELCLSLSEWKAKFERYLEAPEPKALMYTNIFFDFRPAYGEHGLAHELKAHVLAHMDKAPRFLTFLANAALSNPPPLSFFRGFVVERSGEHKNEFDIKARAMMPLSDAARVLSYDLKLEGYLSTAERFRLIGAREPRWAELMEEAAMAYELLMRFRARSGLDAGTSGRFVAIQQLNKLERQSLRSTFEVISDLQRVLSSRYKTDLLRG